MRLINKKYTFEDNDGKHYSVTFVVMHDRYFYSVWMGGKDPKRISGDHTQALPGGIIPGQLGAEHLIKFWQGIYNEKSK